MDTYLADSDRERLSTLSVVCMDKSSLRMQLQGKLHKCCKQLEVRLHLPISTIDRNQLGNLALAEALNIMGFDADSFLKTPLYSLDFSFMIGDVKDFLAVSESSIDALYRQEQRALDERGDVEGDPPGFRAHLEDSVEYRFKVSLPLRVRYGALISLVTSVEWAAESLNENASVRVVSAKQQSRRAVSILEGLSKCTGGTGQGAIGDFEALTHVRNCIAHNGGLLEGYKHADDLPCDVARLNGFSLSNWLVQGVGICIDRGALEPIIDRMAELLPELHQAMHERGLMK